MTAFLSLIFAFLSGAFIVRGLSIAYYDEWNLD